MHGQWQRGITPKLLKGWTYHEQKSAGECPILPGVAAGELIIQLPLPHPFLQLLPLKVLAAAAAAPELILQAETFLRVIPCFGGEKRAWSHWELGVQGYILFSYFSLGGRRKKATAAVVHMVGRTEQNLAQVLLLSLIDILF